MKCVDSNACPPVGRLGEEGDERLFGGAGRDYLDGGPGRDTLRGESDPDRIVATRLLDDYRNNTDDLILFVWLWEVRWPGARMASAGVKNSAGRGFTEG